LSATPREAKHRTLSPPERTGQQLAHDLRWLCFSHSLLVDPTPLPLPLLPEIFFQNRKQEIEELCTEIEASPRELQEHLKRRPRSFKLGLYAQALLEFLFLKIPSIELLATDLVIQETGPGSRTLGALDFLLFDRLTQTHLHLEFAVKFYLGHFSADSENWIGPEGRDRWDHKYQKLTHQQLPLLFTPQGKETLVSSDSKLLTLPQWEKTHSYCLLRGRVFLPWTLPGSPQRDFFSRWISPQALSGVWTHSSDSRLLSSPLKPLPHKTDWMSPALASRGHAHATAESFLQVPSLFTFDDRSELLFVVHESWPAPL
jgi:hypothetical protein